MLFYDTETCGFHGVPVLIQYAVDDGPVNIFHIWDNPAHCTLDLIEWMMDQKVIGFNLAFDQFHLCKIYNMFRLMPQDYLPREKEFITKVASLERDARFGPCLKPEAACDLMLVARKGKYQSTMDRKDIRIHRVPAKIVDKVRDELERRIHYDDIYFSRRKRDKYSNQWKIFDREEPDLKDIVLKFSASSSLKNIVAHALGRDVIQYDEAVAQLPSTAYPEEFGYAPFADMSKKKPWTDYIRVHAAHWCNELALKYAEEDVIHTRDLWYHLDCPEPGDTDSELACMVAACRWKGYAINYEGIKQLAEEAKKKFAGVPMAPAQVRVYLLQDLPEVDQAIIGNSTKKIILEEFANSDVWEGTDLAKKARKILIARQAKNEYDMLTKLLSANRFHASFVVIGTLSSRMAGADQLNAQGIKRAEYIRRMFPLADDGYILCGGDFVSFEVVLADAVYHDDKLRSDLQNGKSIHAVFGTCVYPQMTYEQIIKDKEKYTRSKSAVFALIYGGQAFTLKTRLGVPEDIAEEAYQRFMQLYPGVAKKRQEIANKFCALRQDGGLGTRIEWTDPDDCISSLFGFDRYFTLENKTLKALYELSNDVPKEWRKIPGNINRHGDRVQSISGAAQTALYHAAFNLQSSNMRAAGNHVIQSSGAQITKEVQRKIWDLQPHGVNEWLVQPMNIHDEIMCPTKPELVETVEKVVKQTVDSFKNKVPLLAIDWKNNLKSWADK